MKKRMNFFEVLGILLIVCSLGVLLFTQLHSQYTKKKAAEITCKIEAALPETTPGFPGDYSDPVMPVLQVEGKDYVGLLNIPAYGLSVPIVNEWSSFHVFSCPARFYGSVYDNTMIIGGNDQTGQFDFFDRMNPGDHIKITDMLGTEFAYAIDRIDRAKSADYEHLASGGYPLTLFVRSAYSAEYILVRCSTTF